MVRVTLADVSRDAGVSRSTASLVLNDSPAIPQSTKQRVRASMEHLGYVYNRQAATLRSQRSMALGVVVTEVRNAYFGELVMAVEEAAYDAGFTVLICYSRDEAARQHAQFSRLLERGVDGLIIQPAADTGADLIESLRTSSPVPAVLLARHFGAAHDYVGADNRRAGALLGHHIADIGARSAVFIGGPSDTSTSNERREGFASALSGTDTSMSQPDRIFSPTNASGGARATAELLDRGELPDAIVAFSDAIATGIYAELHARGLRPGKDIALASFDDLPGSDHLVPPLTTVATFPEEIGRASAELLLKRIKDDSADGLDDPSHILVDPQLRIRASTVLWRRHHT